VHDNLVQDGADGPNTSSGPDTSDGALDADRLLALEHAVADLVARGESAEELLTGLLAAVGTTLGWVLGAAWVPDDDADRLRCVAVWHDGSPPLAGFVAITEALTLPIGVGLPGRVWQSGRPDWLADVRLDPNFPRSEAARDAGLAAAMCFPVTSRHGPEALVEFFTTAPLDPRDTLLATAASMGRRVGDALHRHRDEQAVRRSEARLRAVLDAALDCVVIADGTGRVLEFNPAAARTFGYTREQAVGRPLIDLIVPPHLRVRHRAGFDRYLDTGTPTILDQRVVTTGMRADGSEFPVELTITRVALPGIPVFAAYLRDLTSARAVEEELRASRLRVVDATIRERQRLERDLHDGAQQQLISLGLILARARATVLSDRAASLLDDAIARLEESAQELRNLARGLHPSSLTRYGLATACADLVRRGPVPAELDIAATDRYPPVAEATAYFVISEALVNVARYAPGARARVTVTATDAGLSVTVADDGPGGADPARGTGLRGLADRLALLDGALNLDSPVGGGTTLTALIPLPTTAVTLP
jgi:PAS domain S-box-containing protein